MDILVNNATTRSFGTLEDYEMSQWHRILDVNLGTTVSNDRHREVTDSHHHH